MRIYLFITPEGENTTLKRFLKEILTVILR